MEDRKISEYLDYLIKTVPEKDKERYISLKAQLTDDVDLNLLEFMFNCIFDFGVAFSQIAENLNNLEERLASLEGAMAENKPPKTH